MSGTKGMLHYSVETKQEAVHLGLEEHLSYAEAAVNWGCAKRPGSASGYGMYQQEGEASFHKPIGRPPKAQAEQRELERLHMENTLLKKSIPIAGRAARAAQYQAIYHFREEFKVKAMCEFFFVS